MILNKTILCVCLCSFSASVLGEGNSRCGLYFGANAQVRHTGFSKKFGDAIMRKVHNQGHIYVGFKLNDNLAIELGREAIASKSKNVTLFEGQIFNGVPIPAKFSPSEFSTKMKVKAFNIDFVFYQKIFDDMPLSFIPSVGINHSTIDIYRDNLSCGNVQNKNPRRKMHKSFLSIRPSAGLQYDFDNGFSLRASAAFVNTRGIQVTTRNLPSSKLTNRPRVHLKDSFVFGVGFNINL